jgi:hypothetical protein
MGAACPAGPLSGRAPPALTGTAAHLLAIGSAPLRTICAG